MHFKKLISRFLVILLTAIIVSALTFGCSGEPEEKERPAVSKSETETRKTPEVSDEEIKYSNETGIINRLADKLSANQTKDTAIEVEKDLKKPTIFVQEYLQNHPNAPEGPAALKLIASTYELIDNQIGNQKEHIAEAYELITKLYPDSPEAAEANNWLSGH